MGLPLLYIVSLDAMIFYSPCLRREFFVPTNWQDRTWLTTFAVHSALLVLTSYSQQHLEGIVFNGTLGRRTPY